MNDALLSIEHLSLACESEDDSFLILDDVSLQIKQGEFFGLVGESGCGKSMTAMSILKLFDKTQIKVRGGKVVFNNRDLLPLSEADMRTIRTNEIAMIFQDPMTSLNPVYTVGAQIVEALREHKPLSAREAWEQAEHAIATVGIPDPKHSAQKYPHQLSGGMRQRIMIAIALCCEPQLLIADEPTTALDVTVQQQIINLILELQEKYNMAVILITHDLGLIAETATRVGVMYAGNVVETASIHDIFTNPQHPYTQGLLQCIPKLHRKQTHLPIIQGAVPSLHTPRRGCLFAPRCEHRMNICDTQKPLLTNGKHASACWLHHDKHDKHGAAAS